MNKGYFLKIWILTHDIISKVGYLRVRKLDWTQNTLKFQVWDLRVGTPALKWKPKKFLHLRSMQINKTRPKTKKNNTSLNLILSEGTYLIQFFWTNWTNIFFSDGKECVWCDVMLMWHDVTWSDVKCEMEIISRK